MRHESRILQGRDPCSIRVLVPDCRGLDQNFHDVTIMDMDDLLESDVSMPELAELIHKWPPAVINHMMWRQRELEQMRKAAKIKYRQKHPAPCTFCGTIIKNDMYRHVARGHLELAQLWRCPVSWCTVWKGTPQDLMDHTSDARNGPGEIRKVSLEMLFPPWTVTRQLHVESPTAQHSGISNDVLLFSEVGLSLVHHYRMHRVGRPHAAFRGKYLAQLRALLPVNTTLSTAVGPSGAACLLVPSTACGTDGLGATPRPPGRRWRQGRVMDTSAQIAPRLMEQDPRMAAGAVVFDCRLALLPVYLAVSGIDMLEVRSSILPAKIDVVPPEHEQPFGGGEDLLGFICPELSVAPLLDSGTDLEDELPSPDASPVFIGHRVALLPAQVEENVDLAQVLAEFGTLPAIVTPIHDPLEERVVPPAECRTPGAHVDLLVTPAGPTDVPDDNVQP